MCECFDYMYVVHPPCVCSVCGGQKVLDPLELGLQVVVYPKSCARAARLVSWAYFPAAVFTALSLFIIALLFAKSLSFINAGSLVTIK